MELTDGCAPEPWDAKCLAAAGFVHESRTEGVPPPPVEDLSQWRVTLLHPGFPVVTDGNFACFIGQEEFQFVLVDGRIESADPKIIRGLIRAGFGEIGRVQIKPEKKKKEKEVIDDSDTDESGGS